MPAQAKPRVTPVGSDCFRVSFRGLNGEISQESAYRWGAVVVFADLTCETIYRHYGQGSSAFEGLVARLNEIADCQEASAACDKFENKDGYAKLRKLGGELAVAAFDQARLKIAQYNVEGLGMILGMLKAASKRKLAAAQAMIVTLYGNKTAALTVVPGFSVALVDGPTYFIGSTAEYDSWNLHYFGEVTNITAKTVMIRPCSGSKRRLTLAQFASRNSDTVAAKAVRNSDTMQHI